MKLYYRTARKDLYKIGKRTKNGNKTSIDRSKPDNENDIVIIKKGEKYYTWHPKGNDWQFSKTKPDLRSEWQKEIDNWEDEVENVEYDDRDDLRERIEERLDELQSNLDNMPEQLQESSVLNERIEQLQELIDNFDNE